MSTPEHTHSAEQDHIEVVSSETTEYGLRDVSGCVLTMPDWRSPEDVEAALARLRVPGDVLVRTTTTTVTTTGWEAAS